MKKFNAYFTFDEWCCALEETDSSWFLSFESLIEAHYAYERYLDYYLLDIDNYPLCDPVEII